MRIPPRPPQEPPRGPVAVAALGGPRARTFPPIVLALSYELPRASALKRTEIEVIPLLPSLAAGSQRKSLYTWIQECGINLYAERLLGRVF